MNIDYVKLSPTGNITILVKTPVPRDRQGQIAKRLLDSLGGEQVGYIESPADPAAAARLQMMGGEFCGNASMSLGALIARDAGIREGEVRSLRLEVSGCDGLVRCTITRHEDAWEGTVGMPLPTAIEQVDLPAGGMEIRAPLVRMPGIAHLIIPAGIGLDEAALRRLLPEWTRASGADALGALLWNAPSSFINPIVYVPSADTLVREHGCGSGTAAVGCWLASAAGKTYEAFIRQPGGTILVRALVRYGAVAAVNISGTVTLVDEGSTEVDD